jgi:hypothetical protein
MIDVIDIMKQIEHMATSTQEQREERQAESFRLIQEREIEIIRKIEERRLLFQEKHDARMMELRLLMQEIRSRTPKRQIYFGKVKTE